MNLDPRQCECIKLIMKLLVKVALEFRKLCTVPWLIVLEWFDSAVQLIGQIGDCQDHVANNLARQETAFWLLSVSLFDFLSHGPLIDWK